MITPVAALLRRARDYRGITQSELAKLSGIPQSVISAYETGRREPTASSLVALTDALDHELEAHPRRRHLRIAPPAWEVERRGRVDIAKNGAMFPQLLRLTDAIPHRRRGDLRYPHLRRDTTESADAHG